MVIERLTNQKKAILDYLRSTTGHPDAYEVYEHVRERLPQISLATVYRNLDNLVKQGKIRALRIKEDRFNYDGMDLRHNHFQCKNCGRLYNIGDNLGLDLEKIKEDGIVDTIDEYEVTIKGRCSNCMKLENKRSSKL